MRRPTAREWQKKFEKMLFFEGLIKNLVENCFRIVPQAIFNQILDQAFSGVVKIRPETR
jgi:hypothetical protein